MGFWCCSSFLFLLSYHLVNRIAAYISVNPQSNLKNGFNMSNRKTYRKKRIVKIYSEQTHLQEPEKTILNLIKSDLPKMKMLDIGVGGGRTTLHFAKLVKEYVGIDYSEEMIAACRKRFSDHPEHISFKVCDSRNLNVFKDNSFDFILFSFNGIDYVSHKERLKIFQEIKRILNPEGYFCFSSHNLQSIHKLFDLREQMHFQADLPKKLVRWFLTRYVYNRSVNVGKMKTLPFTVFNDGAERFGLQTYYIKPFDQVKQLQSNFQNIRLFLLNSGNEADDKINLNNINDDWIYYLCN